MSKKHEPDNFEQMSIFGIMNLLDNTENTLSSDDMQWMICITACILMIWE